MGLFKEAAERGGGSSQAPRVTEPVGAPSVPKQSTFSKVLNFGKEVGKEVLRAIPRALATPIATTYQDVTGIVTGERPEEVNVPLLGNVGISEDPKKALGQLSGRALDLAMGGFATGAAKTGAKAIAKEGLKQGGKTAIKQAAKVAAVDAAVGGGYGAATGLAEGQTPEEIAKSTAIGAGIGLVAPPLLGGATKVAIKGAGAVGRAAEKSLEKTAGRLERIAAGEDAAKIAEEVSRETGGKSARRFYERDLVEKVPSKGQKLADAGAKAIRAIQKAPGRIAEQFDRYHNVRRFEDTLKAEGIETGDLSEAVQGARYRGLGRAENRLDDYIALRQAYGDDWRLVKEYSHYLDDLDRVGSGQKIAGGRDAEDVKDDLARLLSSLTPEQAQSIESGHRQLQKFLNMELLEAVEAGRISPDQFEMIKEAHPNYVPHDVLDFLEDAGTTPVKGTGKSFQLTKSGIEKAKGSERAIDDIDNAVTRRLLRQSMLNEKNKVNLAIMDTVKGAEEKFGFVPLRTAEQMKTRIKAARDLKAFRAEMDTIRDSLNIANAADRKLASKIGTFGDEIDDLSRRAVEVFTSREAMSEPRLIEELAMKFKTVTNEKEIRDMARALDRHEAVLTDRMRVLSQDARARTRELERASTAYDKRRAAINSGRGGSLIREERAYRFAKENLETTLLEQDKIANDLLSLKNVQLPGIKAERKLVGMSSKNVGERFGKSLVPERDPELETLRQQIAAKEAALTAAETTKGQSENVLDALLRNFKEKKAQITDAVDDLRANAEKKIKGVDVPEGFEKFSFFRDGIREDWLIPEDLGRALKHMNAEEASKAISFLNNTIVGKIITAPAKVTRALTTQKNPVFALFRNPLRDIQTAQITSELGAKDWMKGLATSIQASRGKADELYRLARESGALQGSIFREQNEAEKILADKVAKIGKGKQGWGSRQVGRIGKVVTGEVVDAAGQVMEEATRLGVFSRALKNGLDPREAAKLARNSTVDFGKSGGVLEVANKVIPFLNARAQGFLNLGSAIAKDPTRAARKLFYTAAWPAALLTSHNIKYESYQNIPDNEKKQFWIIMVGETAGKDYQGKDVAVPYYIKIPKGEAQMAVAAGVERVLSVGASKYPESTGEFVRDLAGAISPVSESSVLPPGLSQWVELKSNYSFFRDQQIEPDYTKIGNTWFKTDEIEPKYRSKWNTSEAAKALGSVMNWSPTQIDYVIKTGLMNDLVRVGDLAVEGWNKEATTPFQKASETPFIRSVMGASAYGEDLARKEFEEKQRVEQNTRKIEGIRGSVPRGAAPATQPAGAKRSRLMELTK